MFGEAQRSWIKECKFSFAALRLAVTSRGSETGAMGRSRTITSDAYELGPHSRQQEADDGIDVIADSAAILAGVPPPLPQTVSNGLGGTISMASSIAAASSLNQRKETFMRTRTILLILSTAGMLLTACDKERSKPPVESGKTQSATPDTSVPSAGSVMSSASTPGTSDASTRSNAPMTRAEESSSMPMPGQGDTHSAPVTGAKGASAP